MTDKTTIGSLKASAAQINRILAELGVDIDADIDGAFGGVQLVGFNGSKVFSQGHVPKRELRTAILAIQAVLYEVSRQLRLNTVCNECGERIPNDDAVMHYHAGTVISL